MRRFRYRLGRKRRDECSTWLVKRLTKSRSQRARLRQFTAGKTVVLVTHRTSLLDLVDRLIVIDNGQIMADGPKAQVIEALQSGRVGRAA